MATDISSMLLKALGTMDAPRKSETDTLPDALKELANVIAKSIAERKNIAMHEESAAESRNSAIDTLYRQFDADLRETARIFKELNETEGNSLKLAEKTAKENAAYRQRLEAANRRAEKMSEVGRRQAGERQDNWLGLIGAIGGKGFQGIISNFIKAGEKTAEDIAKISEVRYDVQLAAAAETKEDKFAAADKELIEAKKAYAQAMAAIAEKEGLAVQKMIEGDKTLSITESADAALKEARAAQKAVATEGVAQIQAVKAGQGGRGAKIDVAPSSDAVSGKIQDADPRIATGKRIESGRDFSALSGPLGSIASAIREGAVSPSGLILDEATKAAIVKAETSKAEAEVAAKNLAADAAVSKAGDAYIAAMANDPKGLAAYVEGGALAKTALSEKEAAAANLEAAEKTAIEAKSAAIGEEMLAQNAAFSQKQKGELVGEAEKSAISAANIMNMAVAPPAVAVIGKVMERFKDMFPVFEQTGSALIEMATALPAVGITLGNELASKLIFLGSEVSDAIRFTGNDLKKRYEKSNERVAKVTKKTRAELFSEYQGKRVSEEKARATGIRLASSEEGIIQSAIRSPIKANQPISFTVENIPSTSAGIVHSAPSVEAIRQKAPEAQAPRVQPRPMEESIGVVPVGASNHNIDEWR